jgi:hypothetical protein
MDRPRTQVTGVTTRHGLQRPVAALALALGVLLVAVDLDRGSPESRDAALVVGSFALYALIPVTASWLVVVVVRRRRSATGGRRR